jgi:hypothetical protein
MNLFNIRHIKVETDLVKLAKDNTECRRFTLCNSYLNKSEIALIHNCCDVCEKNCAEAAIGWTKIATVRRFSNSCLTT